ncbi:Uridine kinase [anaerobic digester metagenome]
MNGLAEKTRDITPYKSVYIAIGGVSRSGKTFLAEMLGGILPDAVIIHQDTYIPDKENIPVIRDHLDWERPQAIDWQAFKNAIDVAGQSFRYVIVEGLLVFHDETINQLYNKNIFISLSKEVFVQRKRADLRWGAEPDWYIEHIWQSHLSYGTLPSTIQRPVIIDGEEDFNMDKILKQLNLPE